METLMETAGAISPVLSQYINEEENNRRISKPVLDALKEGGFLRLFRPRSLGGLEADPLTTAKITEEIASFNTAAGWSMMVSNTSAWWCRSLPEKGIKEIFLNEKDTIMAGAFHPPMKATRTDGGYLINGKSPLASNVHDAKWIFVTAFVMEQGQMKINNGIPEIIGVVMNSKDCRIIDTWYTLGMKATDSNDIAAENVFVPDHLFFPLDPELKSNSYFQGPLYKFSAIGASISCLIAPVALAIARNAIHEVKKLAGNKISFGSMVPLRERGSVQRKLGLAEAMVQSSRAYLHHSITECWNKTLTGEKLSMEDKAGLLLAATHTNQTCFSAVDLMYSAAGSNAIYTTNKLAHYYADAQVLRQHGFANDSRYETVAQVYLGLQPDLPVLAF
jgi:alkylation response protein AidB-like acyl-CoA dehydrogenase